MYDFDSDSDSSYSTDAEMDREMEENVEKLSSINEDLMPELPLEDMSDDQQRTAIRKFSTKLDEFFDLARLNKVWEPLPIAINQSIFHTTNPRPLMIYLHRSRTPSTHVFHSQILHNNYFIDLLNENFRFWPWDCTFDSNYNLFLWMLLKHLGYPYAATVAAIPLERYPVLLTLTVEQNALVLKQVVSDFYDATSLEVVLWESIQIHQSFTRPTWSMANFNDRFITEVSLQTWPPKNDSYERLASNSDEYRSVAEKFDEKLFRISSIYRLVSEAAVKVDETAANRILYHGCIRVACQKILTAGFDKNLLRLHGKEYADGYVFTRTPENSLIYALPNLSIQQNGERTMLVCRVNIDPSWTPSDYQNCHIDHVPVEKAPVNEPSGIHVVFSTERIRPLYLVEFYKIGRYS